MTSHNTGDPVSSVRKGKGEGGGGRKWPAREVCQLKVGEVVKRKELTGNYSPQRAISRT